MLQMFIYLPERRNANINEALGARNTINISRLSWKAQGFIKTETRLLLYDVEDYNKLSEKMIELAINQNFQNFKFKCIVN